MAYMQYLKTTPRQRYNERKKELDKLAKRLKRREVAIQKVHEKTTKKVQALMTEARAAGSDPETYDEILAKEPAIHRSAALDIDRLRKEIAQIREEMLALADKNHRVLSNVGNDPRRLMA